MRIAGFRDARRAPVSCRWSAPTGPGRQTPSRAAPRESAAASPSSAAMVSAVRSSMPRKQRRRSTRARSGSRSSRSRSSVFDRLQPRDGFVDRPHVRAMGLLERGDRPASAPAASASWRFVHAFFVAGEAPAVPQEKLREPMPRAQQIGADVLATAQEIARRFFLLGRNVNGGERARRDTAPRAGRHRAGRSSRDRRRAAESRPARSRRTAMSCAVSARCSSKPHGPAS